MRQDHGTSVPDHLVYGNPYLDTVSFETITPSFDFDDGGFDVADPAANAESEMIAAQRETAVQDFVAGLPAADRDVVERIFWRDETQADVARALHVSPAAISKRMARVSSLARVALAHLAGGILH